METKDLSCFIITPVSAGDELLKKEFDSIISNIIRPICEKNGLKHAYAAHELSKVGSINKDIITGIYNSEVVIANLTTFNPNVMYELAVAHTMRKKVISLLKSGVTPPFDIHDDRLIFYTNDIYGYTKLLGDFEATLKTTLSLKEKDIDNPVYNALSLDSLLKKPTDMSQNDLLYQILRKLNQLESNKSVDVITRNSKYTYYIITINSKLNKEQTENILQERFKRSYSIQYGLGTLNNRDGGLYSFECRTTLDQNDFDLQLSLLSMDGIEIIEIAIKDILIKQHQ